MDSINLIFFLYMARVYTENKFTQDINTAVPIMVLPSTTKNSFPYLLTEPTTLPSLTNSKVCKSYVPADVSLETLSYSMKIKILGQWKSIKYLRQFFSILMANFMLRKRVKHAHVLYLHEPKAQLVETIRFSCIPSDLERSVLFLRK